MEQLELSHTPGENAKCYLMNTLRLDVLRDVFILHSPMLASLAGYRILNCLKILKALFKFLSS